MDLSLFTEDNTNINVDLEKEIPNYYLKFNYQNNELSEKYLTDIFQKYGISGSIDDISSYVIAFTHISYCYDPENVNMIENIETDTKKLDEDIKNQKLVSLKTESNNKLEWLGDAIIGMILSFYLINRFPNKDEGFLTKLRSSISNCECLSYIASKLNLNKYLLISSYIESIDGRSNNNRLQEIFKSLIALIDKKFTRFDRNNFVINILESIIDIPEKILNDTNYKDILLRYYQKNKLQAPTFRLEMIEGPSNNRIFTMAVLDANKEIIGIGKDKVKKKAEQNAAKVTLQELGVLSQNNILQWKITKIDTDINQIVNGAPLYYYKYNDKNQLITNEFVNNLLQKFNISETINDLDVYQRAFIHKSYCKEYTNKYESNFTKKKVNKTLIDRKLANKELVDLRDKSYEQLEWYGDSVLKYTITKYLLNRFPDKQDGFLTDLRSKLTNTYALYQIGKELEFDKYIIISKYEETINTRNNQNSLEDVTEAFIGAIMTDLGEEVAEQFIINVFETIIDIADKIKNNNNYKDILLRYYQQQQWGHPKYKQVSVEQSKISDHHYCHIYTVAVYDHTGLDTVGIGQGKSKKTAEQLASKNTLIYYNAL